jgi:hypothetical protein
MLRKAECHFCYLRNSGLYVHESCCLGVQRHLPTYMKRRKRQDGPETYMQQIWYLISVTLNNCIAFSRKYPFFACRSSPISHIESSLKAISYLVHGQNSVTRVLLDLAASSSGASISQSGGFNWILGTSNLLRSVIHTALGRLRAIILATCLQDEIPRFMYRRATLICCSCPMPRLVRSK